MSFDKPSTSSGLFRAFKKSVQKVRHQPRAEAVNSNSDVEENTTTGQIQVIRGSRLIESLDSHSISVAIGKAFLAVEGQSRHISVIEDSISALTQAVTELVLNQSINNYFKDNLYNIDGALKLTAASNALSIFKSFQRITASIIFITTRNFSIQKDLSISA